MTQKTRKELISAYIEFFKSKNHKEIPSSSLIPENDPTVLFTTAGMHPLVPYLLGQPHPLGKRLVNVQKCLRTGDIDEVGDEFHHTFFEMLGNWSLGDYFKKEAIEFSLEFLTKKLKIPIDKLAVTVFQGDKDAQKDEESAKIWENLGIPKSRIFFLPKKDNWWGPAGDIGPCGPDTEIFYWVAKGKPQPLTTGDNKEKWVEIWNDVFMQYIKDENGKYKLAKQKNVDTGMGVERTLAVLNGLDDNYLTEMFLPIIKEIKKISKKAYKKEENKRAIRIVADHIRAALFILGDEKAIKPSNIGQGYVLRRLIRRAIRYGRLLGIKENFTSRIAKTIIPVYPDYPELKKNQKFIEIELEQEEKRFSETLEKGMSKFNAIAEKEKKISGKDAFLLFQSYGFPIEMTLELAKEKSISVNLEEYKKESEKHQELSRTAAQGTFKSGLADSSEQTKKLHTATHLLDEALRRVLKDETIKQKGANITPERTRYDFNFPRKLEDKEIKEIEVLVNKKISSALEVKREEMPFKKAIESGAGYLASAKYPAIVSVYTIIDKNEKKGFFSKEVCTGPHVSNTKEIGRFKIIKEESVSAGIRRIKAIIE